MRSAQARSAEASDSLAKRFSRGIDGDRMRSEVLRVCVILRSCKIRTARSFELPICPEGGQLVFAELGRHWQTRLVQDRKSTRLNSSHLVISYAVFCLK